MTLVDRLMSLVRHRCAVAPDTQLVSVCDDKASFVDHDRDLHDAITIVDDDKQGPYQDAFHG
jgi:hypothetical protein